MFRVLDRFTFGKDGFVRACAVSRGFAFGFASGFGFAFAFAFGFVVMKLM